VRTPHEIDVAARPQIAVSPASAAPGGQATVTGGDFGYETTVTLFLDQAGGTVLGTGQPSGEGAFSVSVTVPSSAAAGAHKIIAVGSDGRHAQAALTVS